MKYSDLLDVIGEVDAAFYEDGFGAFAAGIYGSCGT